MIGANEGILFNEKINLGQESIGKQHERAVFDSVL
jgi:hypothetical protein